MWGRCWDPWSVNNRNMTSEETVSWPLICCCHYWFVWSNSTGSRVNTGEQVQHWWDGSVECGWGLCPAPDSRHCTNCTTLSRLIWPVTRLGSWSNMWTVQAWYRGVRIWVMRLCGDFDSFLLFCRMMHSSRRLAAFYLFTHSSSAVLTLIFRLTPWLSRNLLETIKLCFNLLSLKTLTKCW